jgi:hypothetical protein
METSTKALVPQAMMLALTRSYNAYMIFKKCQVDVAVLIDPTHSREEFEESITSKMDMYMSRNAVSDVVLPVAFVAQDYSGQIAELRDKRKQDSLIKPSRKTKRAANDSDTEETDGVKQHTAGGKKLFNRKGKRSVKPSNNDDSDSDDQLVTVKKKKRTTVDSEQEEVDAKTTSNDPEKQQSEDANSSSDDSEEEASGDVGGEQGKSKE